jgi:secreted trypsin-like serine protease
MCILHRNFPNPRENHMRVKSIIAAAALAAAVLVTPYAVANASDGGGFGPNVVGGGKVSSAPWAAGLYTGSGFFCSGTIIASRWVLSARHCVEAYTPQYVRVGNVRMGQGTRANVSRVVKTSNADFALLQLGTSVNASYAPLASADPPARATVDFYGWGTTSREDTSTLSDVLKKGTLRVVNSGRDVFGGRSIHGAKLNAVAGYGDSGGPMWYGGRVVGVCSWGDNDYTTSDYGSVTANRTWIRNTAGV